MKLEMTVNEIAEIFKGIQERPEQLFEMIRLDIKEVVGDYLTAMMNAELTHYLGRAPYVRNAGDVNHRNGSYGRGFTLKGIGEVQVNVPRDRKGEFKTSVIPRSKQYEEEVARDFSILFLAGVSTRSLSMISERLIGRRISPTEISSVSGELNAAVEAWRQRDLSKEPVKYLFIDGVHFHMRLDIVPVLVAVGVTETGQKLVLSMQSGDKESATSWREFFKDLKARGLDVGKVTLGVMDGLPGLETVFKEEFPQARVQRCQVYVARNVLAKAPQKFKQEVADDLRSIFYAPSQEKSWECFEAFKKKWHKSIPSAVDCLEHSARDSACLTFGNNGFPSEEWISLRTTNIIERLNKEFRRRTKTKEILAGETACYRILAYVSLKMELHWRSKPLGKVRNNLPFLKELAYEYFTHKS